ncbi:hypothetical protein CIG75_16210 [Tumebacillus algifaecis]|uniref:Uncharacterized protein n=1 Tax=Tumebacillus algifaecis TaxID=1214604 RepID=A0A223D407_9BACL|nr:hypothetical protein [Tumebacillus algifaecis]ASS76339.1 hypothetical protein CIG75_16210 [Tumebacillus algifaecis]
MNLTSAFLNKRDISQLKIEELEDLQYHLHNREKSLMQKLEQIRRDLADIEHDRNKVKTEIGNR